MNWIFLYLASVAAAILSTVFLGTDSYGATRRLALKGGFVFALLMTMLALIQMGAHIALRS